jgi:hypothetical protein
MAAQKIYFISGHLDLSSEDFEKHYIPSIDYAIQHNSFFVVGDAKGADTLAQQYLASKKYPRVTVYHMFSAPRCNYGNWPIVGGYKSDESRDAYMTANSTDDIAYVRPMDEQKLLLEKAGKKFNPNRVSGTQKNINCRKKFWIF